MYRCTGRAEMGAADAEIGVCIDEGGRADAPGAEADWSLLCRAVASARRSLVSAAPSRTALGVSAYSPSSVRGWAICARRVCPAPRQRPCVRTQAAAAVKRRSHVLQNSLRQPGRNPGRQ